MQNNFIRNISANTLQLIINQLFGLLIFYALSKGLTKEIFGQINWSLAVLLTVFGLLTFGMDQLLVKKVAAGTEGPPAFSGYLSHVIIFGSLFYGLLIGCFFLFPHLFPQQCYLLLIGVGKLMIFFSTPYKQLAAGLEKFRHLLRMSIVSNVLRGTVLVILLFIGKMTLTYVFIVFITGDLAELIVSIITARQILPKEYHLRPDSKMQGLFIKESLPQAGVIIFTALMSRFDWIIIGLIVSAGSLAEYSFAWKGLEISSLPLYIIAPLMIPLFTRIMRAKKNINDLFFFWNGRSCSLLSLL